MGNIDKERLEIAQSMHLSKGMHDNIEEGMCIMEAVSYVSGEEWSDSPECACPVISKFLRAWNDELPDNERTSVLSDLIPMIIETKAGYRTEKQRYHMIADWTIRSATPAWLRLAGLNDQANTLCSLPEITSVEQLSELRPMLVSIKRDQKFACRVSAINLGAELGVVLNAAQGIAMDAARVVAWNTTRGTAMDAARAVVLNAALVVAFDAAFAAALNAARVAALNAARVAVRIAFAAARHAAFEAASNALAETKANLQKSAKDLVTRMCEITP